MISFQCETLGEAQAVLTACAAIGKEPHACSKQYLGSKTLLNNTLEQVGVKSSERANVSPGEPSITKIGVNTEGALFGVLRAGGQPEAKYAEHLKLLWKRGKVKFDGDDYYV